MSFSVNTNAGAFAALRNLGTSTSMLDVTQSRVNTGLKVSSAKDDAATFSIAQSLRGDSAGYRAVKNSLDRAQSEVDVALAAAEAVSDLLIEMRELAVAGSDEGLDASSRTAFSQKYTELRDQVDSVINNASFNGRNVINGTSGITALTDGTGSTTIDNAASDLTLSTLELNDTNLITYGVPLPSGTAVALAGVSISAATDADFRAALVNLQNDNGGTLGGESIDANTGITTDNVGAPPVSNEFLYGVAGALGVDVNDINGGGTTVDSFAFAPDIPASSPLYLVRDGASSYLTVGNPEGGGSAESPDASADSLSKIEAAIETVNDTLSALGSFANRIELQQTFTSTLSDSIAAGIGNLVDADMAKESANLTAFQTKQQLGLQALSIANQAPQTVLSLFR